MSSPSSRKSRLRSAGIRKAAGYVVVAVAAFSLGALVVQPASAPSQGVLDEAAARIARDAARPVDQQTLEKAAVEGMLATLGDQWSAYYEPSDFSAFSAALEGRYTGVGVWLRQSVGGVVSVASVQSGTPAQLAGLVPGDLVTEIDGVPTAGKPVSEVARLLRGEAGSAVQVTVATSPEATPRTVTLMRVSVASDDVAVERLAGGVLSIRVTSFTRGVGRQVRAAVNADASTGQQRAGIVLDLRNNPGGLVDEAVEVAGAFLDGGVVVSYDRRGRGSRTLQAAPGGDTSTPMVVLVDGGTASAAEIVAAALQDRGRAVIVGSQTFGKGSVQEPATLTDGSAIELTVGQYVTPDGHLIDGVGVAPDISAGPADPATAERKALDVLTGLVASLPTGGRG